VRNVESPQKSPTCQAAQLLKTGGRDGIRTHDLLIANEEKSEIRHGAAITSPFEGASSWTTWTTGLFAFSLCLFVLRASSDPAQINEYPSKADEPSRSGQTRQLKAEGRGFDPHRPTKPQRKQGFLSRRVVGLSLITPFKSSEKRRLRVVESAIAFRAAFTGHLRA